ncbi:MAG: helix-turn-helix domain-containing protein [Solirubrobacteraceae bacterium]
MPVGRPPKPIDPNASAGAALGAEIRARRTACDLTLEALGRRIGYSPQYISDAELAKCPVSEPFIGALDRALDADGALLALLPAATLERTFERQRRAAAHRGAATVDDDVKRRAFLGLGLATVLFGPDAAARALTHAEGEQIAQDWMREVSIAPDRGALLPGLAADLRKLSANGGSQRTIAQLSWCVAMVALSRGESATARRWWARAQTAADASGDAHLSAYIAGCHAYDGVYALYAPAQALALADGALAATNAPCAGRMHALGARARALALLGRRHDAAAAMRDLERSFERLPRGVAREVVGGWSEHRLHHAASFVGAFGGVGSKTAHDEGLRLSRGLWRPSTQIRLHQAAAEADPQYAVATLSALSPAQAGDQFIRRLALRTADACEARGAGVAELREVLAA